MTKLTEWFVRPAKTQTSLGIRPVWSESSLSAWWKLGSSATHLAHSEDSNQTGRMPRLIWVFAGRTLILSCRGSYSLLTFSSLRLTCSHISEDNENCVVGDELTQCKRDTDYLDKQFSNSVCLFVFLSVCLSFFMFVCLSLTYFRRLSTHNFRILKTHISFVT